MFDITVIASFIKKNFNKKDLVFILLIACGYFLTRIINLKGLPIFGDEGIYIHWAKVAWHDASWRFISLTDGKQPLQTWATIGLLKLFPNDALLAGRLFSVITGFIGLTGIFSCLFYLFNKKAGYIGSLFYIFIPYFLFYDRMALSDSAVNTTFIWIFFLSVLLAKSLRLDLALIFGLTTGLGLLTKSSVRIFLLLSSMAPLFFINRNFKMTFKKCVNFFVLFAISGVLAISIYNIQRLSPFLHFVEEKNKTFVMTFAEFLKTPFIYLRGNLYGIPFSIVTEAGFLLTIFGLTGLFYLVKRNLRLGLYVLIWILVPYLVIAAFTKVLFPRYIIFFASLLIITTTHLLINIKNKGLVTLLLLVIFLSVIYNDYTIILDQKNIPLPPVDRGQYIEGITAGWGIPEIIDFAKTKAKQKPVILLAEGDFGVIGDQLDVFLKNTEGVSIRAYWPLDKQTLLNNQKDLIKNHIFIVFSHRQDFPKDWPIKLVKRFEKPYSKVAIHLYELTQTR